MSFDDSICMMTVIEAALCLSAPFTFNYYVLVLSVLELHRTRFTLIFDVV